MENDDSKGFTSYRPGNLIKKDNVAIIAWPGDLCIRENLAQVTPLEIDDLVLKHLGFKVDENPLTADRAYKRKIKWPMNIEEDKKQLEFFVLFKEEHILMGLKNSMHFGVPQEMIEVHFAHDLQNHYAAVTGVDELNVLSKNAR